MTAEATAALTAIKDQMVVIDAEIATLKSTIEDGLANATEDDETEVFTTALSYNDLLESASQSINQQLTNRGAEPTPEP